MTPEEIKALIRKKALEAGIDPTHALTMASIESGFDPGAVNKAGTHKGLFQFGPNEWKTYGGGGDIYDPNAQLDAYAKYQGQIYNTMKGALGRDPTPQELYLGWQQGAGGASSLLKGADKPVGQLTSMANITANGGAPDMTGGQFAGMWHNKYNDAQRKILGRQGGWQGEGDTTDSPWINTPPGMGQGAVPADVVANTTPTPTPDRTKDDWDLAGHGSSPKLPDATNTDKQLAAAGKLTNAGRGLLDAGEGAAPQQPAWIQQAMSARGQVHRPQMPAGLLTDIFKNPEEEKRRRMYAGLLGE